MPLQVRGGVVVTRTEVDRQTLAGLPIVLKVAGAVEANVVRGEDVGDGGSALIVGQKVRHAEAGVRGSLLTRVLAVLVVSSARLCRLRSGEADALDADAAFDGVAAQDLGDVVEDLVHRGGSGKLNTGEGGGSRLIWPKMA